MDYTERQNVQLLNNNIFKILNDIDEIKKALKDLGNQNILNQSTAKKTSNLINLLREETAQQKKLLLEVKRGNPYHDELGQFTDESHAVTTSTKPTIPPMPKPRPTRLEVHENTKITIHHNDGVSETREGGSRAWRNNNPGNLISSEYSNNHGAIGNNNGFAVFPDEASGYEASKNLLETSSYNNLTIDEAIEKRSPKNENDTTRLQREISQDTGLSGDRVISYLSEEELYRLINSIHKFEGWQEGKINKTKKY